MSRRVIVKREEGNVRQIDSTVKNKWCWTWIETERNGVCLNAFIRKLNRPGVSLCLWCDKEVHYGGKGLAALLQHTETALHKKCKVARQSNYRLPSTCE